MAALPDVLPETRSPEAFFLSELPRIERVVRAVCRRNGCTGADAEDFGAEVKLALIDDDYAVLRKFEGKSRLETYLTTVIVNRFRDYRIRKWGKWRPSAAARRLGTTAVQLEQLLHRDGYSFDEAVAILRTHFQVELDRGALAELAGTLPPRTPRRLAGEDELERVAAEDSAEDLVLAGERRNRRDQADRVLDEALADLEPQDRLVLRLRFEDGFTVARIAEVLGQRQRLLYSRIETVLKGLRTRLEHAGVGPTEVVDLLAGD